MSENPPAKINIDWMPAYDSLINLTMPLFRNLVLLLICCLVSWEWAEDVESDLSVTKA